MPGPIMAILAEVRDSLIQQLRMGGTVRAVAREAILLNRRMLEKERAALVGVATPTLHVYRFVLDHCMALGPVRIVATRARDFAFDNGMV